MSNQFDFAEQAANDSSRQTEPSMNDSKYGDIPNVFKRDKFLLRQKLTLIKEQYLVWDEAGQPILFLERPAHYMKGCLALVVLLFFLAAGIGLGVFVGQENAPVGFAIGAIGVVFAFYIGIKLSPYRHITVYEDEQKTRPLLRILQDQKIVLVAGTFTVVDAEGNILGRFRKNQFSDILRKRWRLYEPDGTYIMIAQEDSIFKALMRRLLGFVEELPFLALIFSAIFRTNFIIQTPDRVELGTFNRKFTLLDRYVLDLTPDENGYLDRRLAVALGVLLDTGEKR